MILDPALLVLYQYLKNSHKNNRFASIEWPSKIQEQSFYLNILDSYMHRGCALLSTDILELLDFPDLSSISIKEAPAKYDNELSGSINEAINKCSSNAVVPKTNYDDLFGDGAETSSKPADLFDDYPKSSLKVDDLFDDYQKTTNHDNIFGDYQLQENSIQLEDRNSIEVASTEKTSEGGTKTFEAKDAIRIGFETRQLIVLKKCIIMRILAVIYFLNHTLGML